MVLVVTTVDGRNPANQLRLVVYPCLSRYLQGFKDPRCLAGFLPSTGPPTQLLALFPAAKFLLETDQNVPNSVPAPQGHDLNRAKHLAWFRGNLENN